MDAQILGFLLGIAVAMIGTLVTALGVTLRRNGRSQESNPNLATIDEKLNDILLCLKGIETVVGGCTVAQSYRQSPPAERGL